MNGNLPLLSKLVGPDAIINGNTYLYSSSTMRQSCCCYVFLIYLPGQIVILDCIDLGDMVPLTMLCSWQRAIIIRYISNAHYLSLGLGRNGFGTVNAQVILGQK
jgi:hypothetical protein